MVGLFFTVLCFSGFVYAACAWIRIGHSEAPIFSVSFICLVLFGFALFDNLNSGSKLLMYSGFIFSGIGIFQTWRKKNRKGMSGFAFSAGIALIFLLLISFLISWGMTFTVIDDYVYWGIIGKYLHINHHLPTADTAIIARHLAYTPGTSIFHYFIYTIFGEYNPSISYFAQNIILISALFVVIKNESFKKNIITLCLLITLLTLFFGSVFTKLQVDYLLSVYFFAVLWIYFQKKPTILTIMTISLPVCFLFLIKEIGFLLGLFLLIIIIFDLCFHSTIEKKIKIRSILFVTFIGCCLFFIKYLWASHCQGMGFLKFNTAVNLESVKHSFAIFSDDQIRNGFFLFVKDIIIGPADRLNLPYLFWYCLIVFCWVKIIKKGKIDNIQKFFRLIKISFVFFVIYLLMMYFMQIIIFGVGKSSDHTVGLARYMNILFSPMVFFSVLLYVERFFFNNENSNKKVVFVVVATLSILGFSRLETTLHREPHYKNAKMIAEKIYENIDQNDQKRIGVIPGSNGNDLGIKLLYHLLPHRVNPYEFPVKNKEILLSALLEYDYIWLNQPDQNIVKWLIPLMDQPFSDQGFYKITLSNKGKEIKAIGLKKIFEIGQNKK